MPATKIEYVGIHDDGGDGAFVVIAKVRGRWFHHQGPKHYSHFTAEQAARLMTRIQLAGEIDLQYWVSSHISEDEIEERWMVDAMERR